VLTVKLMGGMGNQCFQFAFALAQAKRLGCNFQLDCSGYASPEVYARTIDPKRNAIRQYELHQWTLGHKMLKQTYYHVPPTVHEGPMPYQQELVDKLKDGDACQGFWQSEKYFLNAVNEVRCAFTPRSTWMDGPYTDILNAGVRSVFIHVRHGDYMNPGQQKYHGVMSADYYREAIAYIESSYPGTKFEYFVFSDDTPWCKEFFTAPNYHVMEQDAEAIEIHAMQRCQHAIIANSSYSWWGSWLGDHNKPSHRTVIAPKRWFNEAPLDARDIVPSRWVKL
jgi:hypothetical protein